MLQIAVCDDTMQELECIYQYILQYQSLRPEREISVKQFASSKELLNHVSTVGSFDIYLLDMLMPGKNGIETGMEIRGLDRECVIIYLTTSRDFALEAFGVGAFQYLVKPVSEDVLSRVLDEAIKMLGRNVIQQIMLKTAEGLIKVTFRNILYVEHMNRILYFHMTDHSTLVSVHIRGSFEEAIASLLEDRRFTHPHKSYVVNMDHIRRIAQQEFIMSDGASIPIVRKNYSNIKSGYLKFLAEKKRCEGDCQ